MKTLTRFIILGTVLWTTSMSLWALSVTPTYQVFRLKPGEKTVGQLTLTEDEEGNILDVTPQVHDFFTLPSNKKFKTNDWLKITTPPFKLKKGEPKLVSFTIQVPKKAQGELAGNLHFATKSSKGGMVSLQLSLAIYVAIEGTEKPDLDIAGVSIKISSHTDVAMLVNNTGNVHLRPRGLMEVFDENEALVMNVSFPPGQPAIPAQPRMYTRTVKDFRLSEGKYTAKIALDDVDWGVAFPPIKKKFSVSKDGRIEAK